MSRLRIVVLEDEPLAAERLLRQLKKAPVNCEVLVVLESVSQAMDWFGQNPMPDLVLSDIQLGDGISFQLFEKQLVSCPIIFTTSYDEYAIRAFKVQSLDYLLKPVKQEELDQALRRFEEKWKMDRVPWMMMQEKMAEIMRQMGHSSQNYRDRFIVKQGDQLIPVGSDEIAYFFTKNDWTCLTTRQGKQFLVDHTLEELEKMLQPDRFFRLNRQFIGSAASIQKAFSHLNGKLKLELNPAPADEVFVSREKANAFRQWWEGMK